MKTMNRSGWLVAAVLACGLWLAPAAWSDELPGKGVRVMPIKSPLAEETFQTLLVNRALEKLGYDVQPIRELEYATGFLALSTGDATFLAVNWEPQQKDFYKNSGGDEKLYRKGTYVANSTQGYLIDKKTAQAHNITSIAQLKDPALAKLFDINGDGKADLTGCNPGWYCEFIIEHHLDVYGLRDTVSQNQGSYPALIADTIARFRQGKPVLYWTWAPYWVSAVMRPGKDVVFLQVPFSSLPGEQAGISTRQPDGSDYGFPVNTQHIVANRVFAEQNPAAARLFGIMELPVADINAQNQRMHNGENSPADVERHVDAWIRAHQATFDGWVEQAKAAAAK